jgi:hypothetical protein
MVRAQARHTLRQAALSKTEQEGLHSSDWSTSAAQHPFDLAHERMHADL